jgi:predicted DNA-binding transcriptional regulator AlpA
MENVQMLFPIEPKEFWRRLKAIVEEVVEQKGKNGSASPPDKHADRPLLKATDVCDIFKVSKPTVYDWLKQGKLKSIKIESRRYFLWQDIEELIKSSRPATTAKK